MSETLTPINILDATGASKPMASYNDGTNNAIAHVLIDAVSGQIVPFISTVVVGSTTTRPADTTAYAFGDLVANSTTAGSVTPGTIAVAKANDMAGTIVRMRLKKSGATLTNASFRVHLYNVLPTVTNGDNGAWLSTLTGWVGAFDVTVTEAGSDMSMGVGIPMQGPSQIFIPVSGSQNLYYLIEARAAYTPASAETFIPVAEVL